MNTGITIAICVAAILILSYVGGQMIARMLRKSEREKTEQMLQEAREKAKVVELEARDTALKIKQDSESEISRRRNELSNEDERLQKRRAELDARIERLEQREAQVNKRQSSVDRRANEIEKLYSDQLEQLQQVSHMTVDEAKQELLNEVEKEARADMARIVRQIEAEARQEGDKRARELITETIQRVASDQVAQVTTSTVSLPNEEMKGRIVGRNGRNIRAFEQAAGVDVIVDDTPEAVTISCFDPTRREIARRSLERLISDGRIHPAHIEKILAEEEKEVQRVIEQAGEQAAFEAGVPGLPLDVLRMLGRLKFRTSYGQNQLTHAVETAMISGIWPRKSARTRKWPKPPGCCTISVKPWTTTRKARTRSSALNSAAVIASVRLSLMPSKRTIMRRNSNRWKP